MKKYTLILALFSTLSCFSQTCYVADPTRVNLKSATFPYVPGSPVKYVRVIIHVKISGDFPFKMVNNIS